MIHRIVNTRGILRNGVIDCLDLSNNPLMRIPLGDSIGDREYKIMDGMFIEPNLLFRFNVHLSRTYDEVEEIQRITGWIEPILTFERIK